MKKTSDPPDPSLLRYLCAALGSGRFVNLFPHPARFAARVLLPAALVIEQHGVARGGRVRRPAGQTRNIGVSGAGEGHPGGAHRSREGNNLGIFEMSGPATAMLGNTKEIRWCEARAYGSRLRVPPNRNGISTLARRLGRPFAWRAHASRCRGDDPYRRGY